MAMKTVRVAVAARVKVNLKRRTSIREIVSTENPVHVKTKLIISIPHGLEAGALPPQRKR